MLEPSWYPPSVSLCGLRTVADAGQAEDRGSPAAAGCHRGSELGSRLTGL